MNITKNMSNEPQTLKEFRLRADIKTKLKAKKSGLFDAYVDEYSTYKLRKSLREEQGFICCYCMSSIATGETKIEHFKPRDGNEELEIDYANLYLACDGEKINCKENQDDNTNIYDECGCKYRKEKNYKKIVKHCDTCKGNRPLEFIKFISIEREIKYKSDGTIYSDNQYIDKELNYILNLNIKTLKENRENAKNDLWSKLPKNGIWDFQKLINKYENQSKKAPYLGMLLYFLRKSAR